MNHPPKGISADVKLQPIMDALVACYGNLSAPHFGKIYVTMSGPVHRNLVADLRGKGVDVLETTDENDDVSTQVFATWSGDEVSLALSGVGPFAAVVHHAKDGHDAWVTQPDKGPTPLAKLVATLVAQAGFQLLARDVVTRTITMNRPDGSTEATLYQALFTDSDRVP